MRFTLRSKLRRLRWPLPRLICAGTALTLTCGCSATLPAAPRPATLPASCNTALEAAQALWNPLHDGSGGYGDTPSLAAPPSLYLTGWSLRLAMATGTPTSAIDRTDVEHWLSAGAINPTVFSADAELSPLARIQLAVATLKALGAAMPIKAAATVSTLRSGSLYRDSASTSPDWASTALAAETLADLGSSIPIQVSNDATSHATALAATMGVKQIDDTGLPILEILVASRTSAALHQQLPHLAALLNSWSATLEDAGASPISIGDLADIHRVAQRSGVPISAPPAAFIAPLRTRDGYYGLGIHASAGDPQMTYQAVELGAAFSATARATLTLGQVASGWLASESDAVVQPNMGSELGK